MVEGQWISTGNVNVDLANVPLLKSIQRSAWRISRTHAYRYQSKKCLFVSKHMSPHCSTLEEMRALKSHSGTDTDSSASRMQCPYAVPYALPIMTQYVPTPCTAIVSQCVPTPYALPMPAMTQCAPVPTTVPAIAQCALYAPVAPPQCAFYPYVCNHNRIPRDWCVICTRRFLFADNPCK